MEEESNDVFVSEFVVHELDYFSNEVALGVRDLLATSGEENMGNKSNTGYNDPQFDVPSEVKDREIGHEPHLLKLSVSRL